MGGGGELHKNAKGQHECMVKVCSGLHACMSTHTAGHVMRQRSTDVPGEGTMLDSRSRIKPCCRKLHPSDAKVSQYNSRAMGNHTEQSCA